MTIYYGGGDAFEMEAFVLRSDNFFLLNPVFGTQVKRYLTATPTTSSTDLTHIVEIHHIQR